MSLAEQIFERQADQQQNVAHPRATRRFLLRAFRSFIPFAALGVLLPASMCIGQASQLAVLTPSDGVAGDQFGTSVGISDETAVIGAPRANSTGAAYVFVKPATGWANMTQTAKLSPGGRGLQGSFGEAVAISGNTIVVGAQGAVYVFVKPTDGWTNMTQTARLTVPGHLAANFTVAISGKTLVLGIPNGMVGDTGNAYVFVEPQSGWQSTTQYQAELFGTDDGEGAEFGASVSTDGTTIVVGAPFASGAYVFPEPSGGWVGNLGTTAKLTPSDNPPLFGTSVSISPNGNAIAIGQESGRIGATYDAYIFVKPASGWAKMTQTVELTTSWADALSPVMLSNDILVTGSPTGAGAIDSFIEPEAGWGNGQVRYSQQVPTSPVGNGNFGTALDISGGTVVIGAPATTDQNLFGQAYVFGKP